MMKISIFERAYYENLLECEGAAAPAAPAGGGSGCGDGAGIAAGDVLGNCCDHSHSGYMGPGCFHMPFPVMPMQVRYGWTTNKKKARKNAVNYKNPYVKGMTFLKDSEETPSPTQYTGSALVTFKAMTNGRSPIYKNVLYLNDPMKFAWMVGDDGCLSIFKALESTADKNMISIRQMKLMPDDKWTNLGEFGEYSTRDKGFDVIKTTCSLHKEKLDEAMLEPLDGQTRHFINDVIDVCAGYSDIVKSPELDDGFIYIDLISNSDMSSNSRLNELISQLNRIQSASPTMKIDYEFHPYGMNDEAYKLNSIIISDDPTEDN